MFWIEPMNDPKARQVMSRVVEGTMGLGRDQLAKGGHAHVSST